MTTELKLDLRDFGYAEGMYMGKCRECSENFMGAKRSWSCEPCAIKKSLEPKVEQPLPDVPELVRYETVLAKNGIPTAKIYSGGKYVRHDQAVAVIAAKDAEISEISNHLDCEADSDSILHTIREIEADKDIYSERAEAAEAKLAQVEKQEVVGYLIKHPRFSDDFQTYELSEGDKHNGYTETPLYAAPVASDADLRAETIEQCIDVVKRILVFADTTSRSDEAIIAQLRALNPSETQT